MDLIKFILFSWFKAKWSNAPLAALDFLNCLGVIMDVRKRVKA